MKELCSKLRSSTFVKYLFSYITLLALVLSGVTAYLYSYMDNEVRKQITQAQVNRLSRIAYQHDEWLSTMLNTAVQIGMSPYIEPFAYDQNPSGAYTLAMQIAPFAATSRFCDQIYLCFDDDDHVYSASSSMTLDMFLSLMSYENTPKERLLSLMRSPGRLAVLPAQKISSTLVDGSQRTVTFFASLGLDGTNMGSMVFLVKEGTYQRLFADAVEADNNTFVLHSNDVLASSNQLDIPTEVMLNALKGSTAREFVPFEWDNRDWVALSLDKGQWDMHYVTVLRASDLNGSVRSNMVPLTLLLIGLAALGVSLALLMTHRNVKPIIEISSLFTENSSPQDHLTFIRNGIRDLSDQNNALMQSNTDLISRLERSLPMQRHDFILRFVKGRYIYRDEAVATAASMGMAIDKPNYAIVLSGNQDYNDPPLDTTEAPFAELRGITVGSVELVALKAYMYVLFADDRETIRETAMMIRSESQEQYGHAIVALSGIHQDFSEVTEAYMEAATAFDNRFIMDDDVLMDYASISLGIEDIMPKAHKLSESINQTLLLRNRSMLDSKIDQLLLFLKHTSMSPFAFRMIYNSVIGMLLKEHANTLASNYDLLKVYDILSLSSCQSINDLDGLLRHLCDTIMRVEESADSLASKDEPPSVIDEVKHYIDDHFTDPELSISAIAEAFDLPITRLSTAFKERARMTPLDYLSLKRIEHSKVLLLDTQLTIKEISSAVGYYDTSSFIRRFKQLTGATPLQYRRNLEEKNGINDSY